MAGRLTLRVVQDVLEAEPGEHLNCHGAKGNKAPRSETVDVDVDGSAVNKIRLSRKKAR